MLKNVALILLGAALLSGCCHGPCGKEKKDVELLMDSKLKIVADDVDADNLGAALQKDYPPPKEPGQQLLYKELYYPEGRTTKASRKLLRGVGNTLLWWAEIPNAMFKKSYATYPFSGVAYGFDRGVKRGVHRLGVGIWETLTFYSPAGRNYEPYLVPELPLLNEPE